MLAKLISCQITKLRVVFRFGKVGKIYLNYSNEKSVEYYILAINIIEYFKEKVDLDYQ